MKERFKYWFVVICNILITVIAALPYIYMWYNYFNQLLFKEFLFKGNLAMCFIYILLVAVFVNMFGGYKIDVSKKSNVLLSQCIGLLCVNVCEILFTDLMVGYLGKIPAISKYFLLIYLTQMACLLLFTIVTMVLYRKIFPPYKVLHIFGDHKNCLRDKMMERSDNYQITKNIKYDEALEDIETIIKQYDIILINDIPSEKRNLILKACFSQQKKVYFTPKISDIIVKGSDNIHIFDTPMLYCRDDIMTFAEKIIKRSFDILISFLCLLLISPLMLLVSLAIFLYDRGPVFYRQTRLTINGRKFKMLKFRSMIVNAEQDGKARLAAENDSRITPVGRFIRACRIDELPQFFNILCGDMSLVGPRPERPEIAEEYLKEIPEFGYRLRVKAGLTGYAQIYGKYNTTSYDKLKLDMIYVENCSIKLDIKLLLLTIKVIFQKESTEGITEGTTNASVGNIKINE